jgi:hypothetical protein
MDSQAVHKRLPFALCDVRSYFLSGDLNKRTIAILTLLDGGYQEPDAYRLMHAFDETLTQDSWYLMVRDAKILDGIRRRPRLGSNLASAG